MLHSRLKNFFIKFRPLNSSKESDGNEALRDYFTGTYLSTKDQQVFHNRLKQAKNVVLDY